MEYLAAFVSGPGVAGAGGIRVYELVTAEEAKRVRLPLDLTVMSRSAVVLSDPTKAGAPLRTLAVGDRVTALGFAEGPLRTRNCLAAPFDGCISRTRVWVMLKTSDGRTGYCSLSEFRWTSPGTTREKPFETVFPLARVASPVRLYDAPVPGWELPQARTSSYLDSIGWGQVVPKLVSPEGELVASRREIEYVLRESLATRPTSFRYEGAPSRVPKHWKQFPPLIQRMAMEPGLEALLIRRGDSERLTIRSLDAVRFFTFYPKTSGDGVPLRLRLPVPAKDAVALLLLTAGAAGRIQPTKIIVRTTETRQRAGDATRVVSRTTVDLDGDGQPEVLRLVQELRDTGCDPRVDRCESPAFVLVALHSGAWFKTAEWRRGEDGFEGY